MFLVGHVPGSGQPDLQRSASLVKNGSGRDRTLIPAGAAHEPTSTGPVRFSSDTALRTHKSIAPTKAFQILQTCFVRREPFQELAPRFRVVLPRGWEIYVVVHGEILPYGGANRIPRISIQHLCSPSIRPDAPCRPARSDHNHASAAPAHQGQARAMAARDGFARQSGLELLQRTRLQGLAARTPFHVRLRLCSPLQPIPAGQRRKACRSIPKPCRQWPKSLQPAAGSAVR